MQIAHLWLLFPFLITHIELYKEDTGTQEAQLPGAIQRTDKQTYTLYYNIAKCSHKV